MLSGKVPSSLRLIARTDLNIRSGDFVSVRVLGRLVGRKWAVEIMGRTFPARSDVELVPGQSLRALVRESGGVITLHIRGNDAAGAEALGAQIPGAAAETARVLGNALAHGHIRVTGGLLRRLIGLARKLGSERRGGEKRVARSLALLVEKGLDPSARGLQGLTRLLACLDQGGGEKRERGQGQRRRERRGSEENRRQIAEALRKTASKRAAGQGEDHPLQLFNHLREDGESWHVVPFSFTTPAETYSGLMKVLFDHRSGSTRRIVLDVPTEDEVMSFVIQTRADGIGLRFHTGNTRRSELWRRQIPLLEAKLHNQGVECDDSVYEEGLFDGFSYAWEDDARPGVDITT